MAARAGLRSTHQPTAQFYHVAVDNHWPYRILRRTAGHSTLAIASRDDEGVIGRQDWYEVGGGESGYIAPDPRDPEIVYANADSGQMTRYDHRTGNQRDVSIHRSTYPVTGRQISNTASQWTEPVFRLAARFEGSVHGGAIRAEELG